MKDGTAGTNLPGEQLLPLVKEIRELVQSARRAVSLNVNTLQVATNFEIGHRLVEYEQEGSRRAGYGEQILDEISRSLTEESGRGSSSTNLRCMRRFYLEYNDSSSQIRQTVSAKSLNIGRPDIPIQQTLSAKLTNQLSLSWSHYVILMSIDNRDERNFYEIESKENNWSLSELKRQFNSGIYERLALSRNKTGVRVLAEKGQIMEKPEDVIKNPLILEFLGTPLTSPR